LIQKISGMLKQRLFLISEADGNRWFWFNESKFLVNNQTLLPSLKNPRIPISFFFLYLEGFIWQK